MTKYIESCLALYDLKVDYQYYDPSNQTLTYFLEKKLDCGLSFKCRSDAYYVFDFSESPIGQSVKYEEYGNNLHIRNERIEVIHAFLACLRSSTQKKVKHTFDMDFIDNYIVCSHTDFDLDDFINSSDPNPFSTLEYKTLCENKLQRLKALPIQNSIDNSEVICKALGIINTIMNKCPKAVYALGILYRAAVYHRIGLEMHSAIFLRSVFEWLAKNQFPNEKNPYNALINKYEGQNNENEFMNSLRNIRNDGVHDLMFPQQSILGSPLSKGFRIIQEIYCCVFGISFTIPFGQTQYHTIEER